MTVSTVVDHNDYTGNGVTISFPYTFRIFKKTDLAVSVIDLSDNISELVLDTDYTVTNAGGYNGGNVVLTTPLANGWKISIARELEPTQETDLRNQGKFFAEVHEDAFDKLTMLIQQAYSVFRLALRKPSSVANWYDALNNYIRNVRDPSQPQDVATKNYVDMLASGNLNRALRVPEAFIPSLPGIDGRRNKTLSFDSAGNPLLLDPAGSGLWGYVLIDSFQAGAKISTRYDALHWPLPDGDGEYYRWDGALPKSVPAGSTPASTGGIGIGAWVGVGDAALRSQLATENGSSLIGVISGGNLSQIINSISPEQFGAVGDGVTDDIDALDACMAFAREKSLDIIFSKQYAISRPYVIYMGKSKNPRHIGQGNMAKIILTTTAKSGLGSDSYGTDLNVNAAVIVAAITGTGHNQQPKNFRWEGIDLDTTVNADYCMYTSAMQSASVKNFRTYNSKTGVQDNGSWNTLYENIKGTNHSVCGIRKTKGTSTTIRNCYMEKSAVGYRVYSGYSKIEGCACDTSTDVSYWLEGNPVALSSDSTFSLVSCGAENSGSAVVRITGTLTASIRNFQAFNYDAQQSPTPDCFLDLQSNTASVAIDEVRYLGVARRIKDSGTNNTVIIRNMTTRATDVRDQDIYPNSTRIIELNKNGVRVASGYDKTGILITEDNISDAAGSTTWSRLFNKQRIWRYRGIVTRTAGQSYGRLQVTLPFTMTDNNYSVNITPEIYHTDMATYGYQCSVGPTDKTTTSFFINVNSGAGNTSWASVVVTVIVMGVIS